MNPDATLDDDCIASLRSELNGDNSIGILVPVVRSGTGIRTMSAGRLPTIRALFTHYFGLSRAFPSAAIFEGRYLFLGVHDKIDRDIEWAAGCCLYITQNAIRQVGLFSERWFMYGEDIDYCKRTRDRGFSIRLVTDATAFHAMAVSVSAIPGAGSLMWPVNTFDFYRSAYDPGLVRRITWKAIFSLGLSSRAFLIPVRGRFAGASWRRGLRLFRLAMAVWYLPPVLNEPDHFDEGSQTPWRESILQSDLAHGRGDRDQ